MTQFVRNPDGLAARDPQGYDKVLSNPVVKSEFTSLIAPIVDADVVVEGIDDRHDAELTEAVNRIPGMAICKREALFAYLTGVRFIEMLWGIMELPTAGQAYFPMDFKPHDASRFAYDHFGNLFMTADGYLPPQSRNDFVWTADGKAVWVPPEKMVIHRYRDGDGRYGYGAGEALNLYRWVRLFDAVVGQWADFNDGYANPWRVLKLDKDYVQALCANGITATDIFDEHREKLASMISNDTMVTDARNEFELMSPARMEGGQFEHLLAFVVEMIRISITGENVTQTAGGGDGLGNSLAKAQEASRHRQARIRYLASELEDTIRKYVVMPIIRFNPEIYGSLRKLRNRVRVRIMTPRVSEADQIELIKTSPVEQLKSEYYRLAELPEPTARDILEGKTFNPSPSGTGVDSLFDPSRAPVWRRLEAAAKRRDKREAGRLLALWNQHHENRAA